MVALEILKEWKVAITSVKQGYESTEEQQNYKIESGTTYGERGISIDIGKTKDNFDKDRKPKCFNCNIYGHMAKECKKPKKKENTQKYYKCKRVEHISKDCKMG